MSSFTACSGWTSLQVGSISTLTVGTEQRSSEVDTRSDAVECRCTELVFSQTVRMIAVPWSTGPGFQR